MEQAKLAFIITTVIGLILVVAILPRFIEYLHEVEPHFVISGFQDMHPSPVDSVSTIPREMEKEPSSLIRKSLCGDSPCEEGTFCDDLTQTCVPLYPSSSTPDTGYYA